MNLRKVINICLIAMLQLGVAVSIAGRSTPRIVTQKLACQSPINIMDIVTNTTGTSPSYVIRADVLETAGEELGSDLGTSDANLYIRKLGNGMTVPYYIGAGVQLSQFITQWQAGQTLRLTITYIASGASSFQDITIPAGTANVLIQEPVMIIPPYPIIDAPTGIDASLLPSGILRISWDAVTGATGYNLYRSIDGGNSFTMVAQTANDYYDDAVTLPVWELRIYHYRVSAVSGRVESEPSEILSVALDRIASVGNSLLGIPLGAGVWVSEWVQGQSFMIDSVSYWNANIQQWMTAFDLGGFWDGDFQLSEGMVILLNSYAAPHYTLFTSTSSLGGDYSISIAQGYNLILVPPGLDPDLDSVQDMAGEIGPGVESISLWDTEHTLWKQYCPQYPSYDWGAVQPWQRLFIYSTVAYPNWYAPRGGVK